MISMGFVGWNCKELLITTLQETFPSKSKDSTNLLRIVLVYSSSCNYLQRSNVLIASFIKFGCNKTLRSFELERDDPGSEIVEFS